MIIWNDMFLEYKLDTSSEILELGVDAFNNIVISEKRAKVSDIFIGYINILYNKTIQAKNYV